MLQTAEVVGKNLHPLHHEVQFRQIIPYRAHQYLIASCGVQMMSSRCCLPPLLYAGKFLFLALTNALSGCPNCPLQLCWVTQSTGSFFLFYYHFERRDCSCPAKVTIVSTKPKIFTVIMLTWASDSRSWTSMSIRIFPSYIPSTK